MATTRSESGRDGGAETETAFHVGPGDRAPGERANLRSGHRIPAALLPNDTVQDVLRARCHWGNEREKTSEVQRSHHWIFSYRIVGYPLTFVLL